MISLTFFSKVPITLKLCFCRFLIEPLACRLGVSRRKPRPLTENAVLERAYKQNKAIGPDLIKVRKFILLYC